MTNIYKVVFFSKMAAAKRDGDSDVEMELSDLLNGVEIVDPDEEEPRTGTRRGARRTDARRESLGPSRADTRAARRQIAAAQAAREAKIAEYELSIRRMTAERKAAREAGQTIARNPRKRKEPGLSSNLGQPKIW